MIKKLIFLNVLIISVLMLSGCGQPINVTLPDVNVSGDIPPVSVEVIPANPAPADPAPAPATAPAQGVFSNNLLIYFVVGLVIVIALIALVAVASKNNNNSNTRM